MNGYRKQRGVVLVISLLLLLVITLVGISTLGNTALEESMTGNMQAKHEVFQAADTSLEEAVDDTEFLWRAVLKGIDPSEPELVDSEADVDASFAIDEDGEPIKMELSTKQVTASYKGNTMPVGENATSIRMGASSYQLYHYYLEGTAELEGHSARAVHVQGAYLKGASTQ